MRGSLARPSTAVGAALEQVQRFRVVTTSSSSTVVSVVVAVGVRVAALDAHRREAGRLRLWWTGARSDRVDSL